jgi:Tfp pilus assembly protein PilF
MKNDIFVERKDITQKFIEFIQNDKQLIWSIYGAGGIGKSTLLNHFYEQLREKKQFNKNKGFFNKIKQFFNKKKEPPIALMNNQRDTSVLLNALDIWLFEFSTDNTPHFNKIKAIIQKKYVSVADKLESISTAAEKVPVKSMTELIEKLDKDNEYIKELGIVWGTVQDTLKVITHLLKRDKKDEKIATNPELHLIVALLTDIKKAKDAYLLIDTFEKIKDIEIKTTLELRRGKLELVPEYRTTFDNYIGRIIEFIEDNLDVKNKDKEQVKVIITGRDRVVNLNKYSPSNIFCTELIYFNESLIEEYFKILRFDEESSKHKEELLPLLTRKDAIKILKLTKGNPLLIFYLKEYIRLRYHKNWAWNKLESIENHFKNSQEEYGLLYYLTNRIATHLSGWENTLWKLLIPRTLSLEISNILYPETKNYFIKLTEVGVLKRGQGDNYTTFYLHDEVKECLMLYRNKKFPSLKKEGQVETSYNYDAPEILAVHQQLKEYYDKQSDWHSYPKDFNSFYYSKEEKNFKSSLLEASYHTFACIEQFEQKYLALKLDRFQYWITLAQSLSITYAYISWIGHNVHSLNINQLLNYKNFLIKEYEKYLKYSSKEFIEYLFQQNVEGKLPFDWNNNKLYLEKLINLFPNEFDLLRIYANFLYFQLNEYDLSEKYYKQSIDINPNFIYSLVNYAYFLIKIRNNYNQAEKYYQQAITIEPNKINILEAYAVFLLNKRKNYNLAEEYYIKIIQTGPFNLNNISNYSYNLFVLNKIDKAKILLENVFSFNPTQLDLLAEIWYYRLTYCPERYAQAIQELEKLTSQNVKSIDWDFQPMIQYAQSINHPHIELLIEFDKKITQP